MMHFKKSNQLLSDEDWYNMLTSIKAKINNWGNTVVGTLQSLGYKAVKGICRLPGDHILIRPNRAQADKLRDDARTAQSTVISNAAKVKKDFDEINAVLQSAEIFLNPKTLSQTSHSLDTKQSGEISELQKKANALADKNSAIASLAKDIQDKDYATKAQMHRGEISGAPWDHFLNWTQNHEPIQLTDLKRRFKEGQDKILEIGLKALKDIETQKKAAEDLVEKSNKALIEFNQTVANTYGLLFEQLSRKFGPPSVYLGISMANITINGVLEQQFIERYLLKLKATNATGYGSTTAAATVPTASAGPVLFSPQFAQSLASAKLITPKGLLAFEIDPIASTSSVVSQPTSTL